MRPTVDLLEPPAENVLAWAATLDLRWIDDSGQPIERPRPVIPGDPRDLARKFIGERGLPFEAEEVLALWSAWRFYQKMKHHPLYRDWLARAYPNFWRRTRAANVGPLFDGFLGEHLAGRARYPEGLGYVDPNLGFGESLSLLKKTHGFAQWGSRGPTDKNGQPIEHLCAAGEYFDWSTTG